MFSSLTGDTSSSSATDGDTSSSSATAGPSTTQSKPRPRTSGINTECKTNSGL